VNRLPLLISLLMALAACGTGGGSAAASGSAAAEAARQSRDAAGSGQSSAAAGSPAAASGSASLIQGYSQIAADQLVPWLAKDAGIFEQNGINVDLQMVASTAVMAALLANQIQLGTMGGAEVVNADVGGADAVILANIAPVYSFKYEVAKEIKTPADLKGKKIGISRPGSTTDIGTRAGLARFGIDVDKDVTVVQIGTAQQIRDALIGGVIAGAMQQPPETMAVEKEGFHPLFDFADLGLPAANAVVAVRKSWLDGHRDLAQRYVDAIVQATVRAKADKALTEGVIKRSFKYEDPAVLDTTYDYFAQHIWPTLPYAKPEQFSAIIDVAAQTNPKVKGFDVSSILDPSFVKSAEDRGLARS
jgi:NitT/TauT family transport system substrate-binding protein